ncbi:MAG: hypothetical protein VCE12_02350, partial [Candidatus Latescibacterota bacterium]
MRELRLFFTALTFCTRLPGLGLADVSGDGLSRATRYFPLVGIIVGAWRRHAENTEHRAHEHGVFGGIVRRLLVVGTDEAG